MSKEDYFFRAYSRMAELGWADTPGSAEYKRVLGEWKAAGMPSNVVAFIAAVANAPLPFSGRLFAPKNKEN